MALMMRQYSDSYISFGFTFIGIRLPQSHYAWYVGKNHLTAPLEKVRISGKFALQVEKPTDISGHAQLLANVRFIDGNAIKKFFILQEIISKHKRRKNFSCYFRLL